jgi:hypothetical protein
MTATYHADQIIELEEVRASLSWDALKAAEQAVTQRDNPTMHETADMRAKRLAYADAVAAVGAAAVAYCAAIQRGIDALSGAQ